MCARDFEDTVEFVGKDDGPLGKVGDVLVTIIVVSIVACVTGYISGFLAIGAQRYTEGYGVLLILIIPHVFGHVIHNIMLGFSAASLGFFRREAEGVR